LSAISVNALKPVTARATGARAYNHALASPLPTHRGLRRLPVGIQLVAPRFARRLLACAAWIWRELGSPDMVGYRD
jgi:Asp-tRNA(Asn)/Glu-tRNA(Gln) amidotransferase A subunit family amidase